MADPPVADLHRVRYSWQGDEAHDVTWVTCRLEAQGGGTRFTWEHIGFKGAGGFFMSRLLASVRRKMLEVALPAVLNELDDQGHLRAGSLLRAKDAVPAKGLGLNNVVNFVHPDRVNEVDHVV